MIITLKKEDVKMLKKGHDFVLTLPTYDLILSEEVIKEISETINRLNGVPQMNNND